MSRISGLPTLFAGSNAAASITRIGAMAGGDISL